MDSLLVCAGVCLLGHRSVATPLCEKDQNKMTAFTHQPYADGNKPQRDVPVCLDYLKGVCGSKRANCKYGHPAAQAEARGGGSKVCEVFMLTGFCKFGAVCRDCHPSTAIYTPICAPAPTCKMTGKARDIADLVSLPDQQHNIVEEQEDHRILSLKDSIHTMAEGSIQIVAQEVVQLLTAPECEKSAVINSIFAQAIASTPSLTVADLLCTVFHILSSKEKDWYQSC